MLDPEMLLLDEPFSAVDPATRLGLYERFEEVQRARAVSTLLVTHDIREARRLADFLVVLQHGKIVQSGTSKRFLRPRPHPMLKAHCQCCVMFAQCYWLAWYAAGRCSPAKTNLSE